MKLITILFLIFSASLFAQEEDTTIVAPDSVYLPPDSLHAVIDTVSTDTTGIFSEGKNVVKADTLIPINQKVFFSGSDFIIRDEFLKLDYRYTGDILRSFPFDFQKNMSFLGQPNQVVLYGVGFNGISYFRDGVLQNNRYYNSLDLNTIQSEYIDSIEVIPSTRAFLYGPVNNFAAVNFITRDFVVGIPYTRIKYYEGPEGEAMLDGTFNALIMNNFNVSFDVTNRTVDNWYVNSEYGIWNATVKLKYFISDNFNIIGSYNHTNSKTGLNGGVDIDAISETTGNINSVFYSSTDAPVNYTARDLHLTQHHFNLKLLARFDEHSSTDANIFYKFYLNEVNDDETAAIQKEFVKDKVYGAVVTQRFRFSVFDVTLNGNFDYSKANYRIYSPDEYINKYTDVARYSVSPILSAHLFDSTLIPSVFFKYSNYSLPGLNSANSYTGAGADLTYKLFNGIQLYGGYSVFERLNADNPINNLEAGVKYKDSLLQVNARIFRRTGTLIPIGNTQYTGMDIFDYDNYTYADKEIWGLGFNAGYLLWKILLEANFSYYFSGDDTEENLIYNVPEMQLHGGVYYKNILFDGHLDLKTGFEANYIGKQKYAGVPFTDKFFTDSNLLVDPSYCVNFTLAGEIQKVAIVYFAWENLTDNDYYITPYYPMPARSIRFGLAWELFN